MWTQLQDMHEEMETLKGREAAGARDRTTLAIALADLEETHSDLEEAHQEQQERSGLALMELKEKVGLALCSRLASTAVQRCFTGW